ncbi:baseplate J/gp47 family protein [Sphingomonas sp. BIUV-7]|uniref:Baseplate J/gp47 family protein n=1 Tax=Sphingomonas natans TaxID=3063330 RepID=A0ABT8YCS2_9SPHN|nr:baseplate J/gp47 family protein [Sphingomonas sp. BIUV-7]MDO6416123.1 baseplate J/gp47 family protein [Sphingomonas sp. BIUV-7]
MEDSDDTIAIAALAWDRLPDAQGNLRAVLVIDVEQPGDFRLYRLTLIDPHAPPRIDRFFNDVIFSFKQGCPTAFDCASRHDCPDEAPVDWPIDYLARDFESFRVALMDFAAQRYPDWQERIPADVGSMLAELSAALGDEFSYIQDRHSREGYLETLSQRRSLAAFAGLVDYQLDEGLSASTYLRLTVDIGGVEVPAGLRAWADPEGMPAIAFEVGTGLRSYRDIPAEGLERATYWLHALWNDMPAHVPDPALRCLEVGARELWLVGEPLVAATLPGTPDPAAVTRFWIGRKLLIETRPVARDAPQRRLIVEVDAPVEVVTDPLITDINGNPINTTRIHWRAEDALPFELDLASTFVSANLVPAAAGLTVRDHVAIGFPPPPPHDDLPTTVERAGPFDLDSGARAILHRRSLPLTDMSGLGWRFADDPPPLGAFPIPEILIEEVQPNGGPVDSLPAGDLWHFQREILLGDERGRLFTIEPGVWRDVISFDRLGQRIVHQDYAADGGATVRFGDGTFGLRPPDGALFRITYRTGPGRRANLPADSITLLAAPPGAPQGAVAATEAALVAVSNPLPVTGGRDPEDMELARRIIPEAFRALVWRAVLDQDYREIAERLPWVQRAGAVTRWTGSWLTTFVTPDPLGSATLSEPRRTELEALMDRVRQAGREVHVIDPVFLDIDLDISICIEPGAYFGQVQERVVRALTGPARYGEPLPFFHPDNWSFGDPLYRAEVEAATAAVPGVLAVDGIRLRRRGQAEFAEFADAVLVAGTDRILRLANDPRLPDQGSLAIRLRAVAPA